MFAKLLDKLGVPKISQPEAKFIRTTEGWLIIGANFGLIALGALPHGLPWTKSALYGTILNGLTVVCRSGLKYATAANKAVGIGPPENYDNTAVADAQNIAKKVFPQIAQEFTSGEPLSVDEIAQTLLSDVEEFGSIPTLAEIENLGLPADILGNEKPAAARTPDPVGAP